MHLSTDVRAPCRAHQSGHEQDMSVSCGCTTTMYDFNAPLWFPTTPGITIMDPILLMFSIFILWRLVRVSPDQGKGIMQEIKTAILKEQKTTARGTGKRAASLLLE